MSTTLFVGTEKGLFALDSDDRRESWSLRGPMHKGWQVYSLRHVARDRRLVAVLSAAHVEEVVGAWVEAVAEARARELEPDAAPLAARPKDRDVPAVGVDVHELGVERADAQRRVHQGASRMTTTLPT